MSTAAATQPAAPAAAAAKEKAPAAPTPGSIAATAAAAAADAQPDSAPNSDVSPAKAGAAAAAAPPPAPQVETGVVLFTGGTDWAMLGRGGGGKASKSAAAGDDDGGRAERYPPLPTPVRLAALDGVRVAFVAAGPAATHAVAGDDQGRVWTWGRNDRGQLGHGDFKLYNAPKVVAALQGKKVEAVGATAGKSHTVVWARDGSSWSWGLNTQGQLGIGSISAQAGGAGKKAAGGAGAAQDDVRVLPQRVAIDAPIKCASAGSNFTVWLTRAGKVLSAGHPENGRLGTGTDYMYNTKDSSIKLAYRPQPRPLPPAGDAFQQRTISAVAAGAAHVLAADTEGALWSWGCGNYGVLGHKVQQDEMRPRRVEAFSGRLTVVPGSPLAAGGTSSFAVGVGPQLFAWGKLKVNGDCSTSPAQLTDLSGWNIRHMSCGPGTFAVAADNACIAWGAAISGELGQGAGGKKSSANPVKVDALDGAHCLQTAAGVGFTMFLLRSPDARADKAELWSPPAGDVEEAPAAGGAGGGAEEEGGAGGAGGGGKRGRPAGKASGGGGGAKKGKK